MGNKPSRQEFVLHAPTEFSEGLVRHLKESPETDTSRWMDMEGYIQERVQTELKKLQDRQRKVIDVLMDEEWKQNNELEKQSEGSLNSNLLKNEFAALRDKLEKESTAHQSIKSETLKEIESTRSDLFACMSENADRSLLCRPFAEKFVALTSAFKENSSDS
ncbi:DUF1690 family protein [Schizosaccharomyces cryophilus OY26]|uniref:DUF1690 family protein n=1 Tax=Schizosaccharomyces cryophilus (strain OY26 / ATCC MYA-4695 / CBS 11777 / NBRC 106824 / NRRL Y48691) TaxID=653667 RepID=S9X0Z5_SCHCR|nr:DUF1690 family protein [Schizosaccharomyces cryophilus OY26]EPY50692.1 DUF1690 family protein [Schizosaccharomyces cryophilus OY26]